MIRETSKSESDLEANLAYQLRRAKITGWQREVLFALPRRYRADFLWEKPRKLIVEVMGGLWGGKGRHSRMAGYTNDSRKMALAQELGFRYLYLTPEMLENTTGYQWSEAITLIERALGKEKAR